MNMIAISNIYTPLPESPADGQFARYSDSLNKWIAYTISLISDGTADGQTLVWSADLSKFTTNNVLAIDSITKKIFLKYSDSIYADMSVGSDGVATFAATGGSYIFPAGTAAKPALQISTVGGFYSTGVANTISYTAGGYERFRFGSGSIAGASASAGALRNEVASATNPTLSPNRSDVDTGVGSDGDDSLSLITGGVEGARVSESDNEIVVGVGGSLYIGDTTTEPTASLHVKAGTATAGTAPIKFKDGTLLTTPEQGTIEYANDKFYITNVGHQRSIDRTSDVLTSTVTVANTTTETTIYTGVVGANDLKTGNILKINCNGILSNATAADDVTIKIYIGSAEVLSYSPEIGNVVNGHWHISGSMTVRSTGATGSMAYHLDSSMDDHNSSEIGVDSVDTTTSNNITLTITWDNAKTGNTLSIYQGFLEFKN